MRVKQNPRVRVLVSRPFFSSRRGPLVVRVAVFPLCVCVFANNFDTLLRPDFVPMGLGAIRSTGDSRGANSAGAMDGSWSGAGISWTRTRTPVPCFRFLPPDSREP